MDQQSRASTSSPLGNGRKPKISSCLLSGLLGLRDFLPCRYSPSVTFRTMAAIENNRS